MYEVHGYNNDGMSTISFPFKTLDEALAKVRDMIEAVEIDMGGDEPAWRECGIRFEPPPHEPNELDRMLEQPFFQNYLAKLEAASDAENSRD